MGGAHDIEHTITIYRRVLISLAVLTAVTVGVSYLEFGPMVAIAVALIIASVKAGLVACYFMHLISERKMIYWALLLTIIFFLCLLSLPSLWAGDAIVIS